MHSMHARIGQRMANCQQLLKLKLSTDVEARHGMTNFKPCSYPSASTLPKAEKMTVDTNKEINLVLDHYTSILLKLPGMHENERANILEDSRQARELIDTLSLEHAADKLVILIDRALSRKISEQISFSDALQKSLQILNTVVSKQQAPSGGTASGQSASKKLNGRRQRNSNFSSVNRFFNGSPICKRYNFSRMGCSFGRSCNYMHVCFECKGAHVKRDCPLMSNRQAANLRSFPFPNRAMQQPPRA